MPASSTLPRLTPAPLMPPPPKRTALIVAGPTASGKSALALALAEQLGGTVINADSMQVYRELRILTARPTPAEEAVVPHALYGVRPAREPGSAAWWRGAALAAMDAARDGRSGAGPVRRHRAVFLVPHRWTVADAADLRRGAPGGAGHAEGDRPDSPARHAGRGRSDDRRAAASDGQPARRAGLGSLAQQRARPGGLAG